MKFIISHGEGLGTPAAPSSYRSLEEARQALRRELGWPDVYLGPGYTTDDGKNQIWYAHRKPPRGKANIEDERAPRITRSLDDG